MEIKDTLSKETLEIMKDMENKHINFKLKTLSDEDEKEETLYASEVYLDDKPDDSVLNDMEERIKCSYYEVAAQTSIIFVVALVVSIILYITNDNENSGLSSLMSSIYMVLSAVAVIILNAFSYTFGECVYHDINIESTENYVKSNAYCTIVCVLTIIGYICSKFNLAFLTLMFSIMVMCLAYNSLASYANATKSKT